MKVRGGIKLRKTGKIETLSACQSPVKLRMAKERDLLPVKPTSLQNFNAFNFHPDWNGAGRRYRTTWAENTFEQVEEATYNKGVVKVVLTACVDDQRRLLDVLQAFPPGTPIAAFFEEHEETIKRLMKESQMMFTNACLDYKNPSLKIEDKLKTLRNTFNATDLDNDMIDTDFQKQLERTETASKEIKLDKPKIPVYAMQAVEAQHYFQTVMDFVQKEKLKVKRKEFRKWPMEQEGRMLRATEFVFWNDLVESVLPRQSYFGRNKGFKLDNQAARLTLALAKLLENLGVEDPNTFAVSIPPGYEDRDWNRERDILLGKVRGGYYKFQKEKKSILKKMK